MWNLATVNRGVTVTQRGKGQREEIVHSGRTEWIWQAFQMAAFAQYDLHWHR